LFLIKNYQDEELDIPKGLFETEGAVLTIISSESGFATGMSGAKTEVDGTSEELNVADFDAIVFIGGLGVIEYHNDPIAQAIAQQATQQDKILAAICLAPVILANAGVLDGKQATVLSGAKRLKRKGCTYVNEAVVVDGDIITANGPSAAEEFAREIITALSNMK
jgi:protease I